VGRVWSHASVGAGQPDRGQVPSFLRGQARRVTAEYALLARATPTRSASEAAAQNRPADRTQESTAVNWSTREGGGRPQGAGDAPVTIECEGQEERRHRTGGHYRRVVALADAATRSSEPEQFAHPLHGQVAAGAVGILNAEPRC